MSQQVARRIGRYQNMLLIAASLVAVVTVPLAGGRVGALGEARLRVVPAIFASLLLQIAIISVLPAGNPALHRMLHVVSYALAAWFLVANRRVVGMAIVALGTALNLAAIMANGGVMPASAHALHVAGIRPAPDFANSAAVAHPRLLALGDILAVPKPWPLHNAYSIGDVCIAVGVLIVVHALCGSRLGGRRRRSIDVVQPVDQLTQPLV